jgi:hypothetical protein
MQVRERVRVAGEGGMREDESYKIKMCTIM